MERRKEPRCEADQPVRVTVLGGSNKQVPGRILNWSGTGLGLEVSAPLPAGTLLEVEWQQTLLLAEVCYCQESPAGFVLGLKLEHCLLDTAELARLARALLGESMVVLTPHS